jgi:hypothetical protein
MCHLKNFDFEIIKVVHLHNCVMVSFSEIVIVRNIEKYVLQYTYSIDKTVKIQLFNQYDLLKC